MTIEQFAKSLGYETVADAKAALPDFEQQFARAQLSASAKPGESPKGSKLAERIQSLYSDVITAPKDYSADITKAEGEIGQEESKYTTRKGEIADREKWGAIAAGLSNLAAGLYGKKTGVDMSGAKTEAPSLEKEKDRSLQEYESNLRSKLGKAEYLRRAQDEGKQQSLRNALTIKQQLQEGMTAEERMAFEKEQERKRDAERGTEKVNQTRKEEINAAKDQIKLIDNQIKELDAKDAPSNYELNDALSRLRAAGADTPTEPSADEVKKLRTDWFGDPEMSKAQLRSLLLSERAKTAEIIKPGGGMEPTYRGEAAPAKTSLPPPPEQKQDPIVLDFAAQNKLTYEKAKGILVNRGYQPKE